MSYIMIDWDDNSCLKILQSIRQAITEKGKLLIIDSIIPVGDQYSWIKWVDLFELCLGYGKVRTEAEFREIFEQAGFQWLENFSVGTPSSLMELTPV